MSNSVLLLTACLTFVLYRSRELLDQLYCTATSVYWLVNLVKIFSIGYEIELFLSDLFPLMSLGLVTHLVDST